MITQQRLEELILDAHTNIWCLHLDSTRSVPYPESNNETKNYLIGMLMGLLAAYSDDDGDWLELDRRLRKQAFDQLGEDVQERIKAKAERYNLDVFEL